MNITNNIESNFNEDQQYNNFSKVKKTIKIVNSKKIPLVIKRVGIFNFT